MRLAMLGLLALTGCGAGIQGQIGQIGQATQEIDNLLPQLIMQKYAALHNLKVGMQQIDSQSGMVVMTNPPPIVTPTTPVSKPAPATPTPVPMIPPSPTLTPPTTPPSPIVTPTARRIRPSEFFAKHHPTFKLISGPVGVVAAPI